MFRRVFAVAAAACAALPSAVFAQSASCVNPQPIGLGDTSFSNLVGYDEQAVRSDAGFGEDVIYRAGWFAFTPDVTARYMFGLCGANDDTKIALGVGCPSDPFTAWQTLGYNDDTCAMGSGTGLWASKLYPGNSGLSLNGELLAGHTYLIAVGGFAPSTTPIHGALSVEMIPAPINPCASTVVATIGANTLPMSAAAPTLSTQCGGVLSDMYFTNYMRFTAPYTGEFIASSCAQATDTMIAVLTACGDGSTVIACNDDACGAASRATFSASAGQTVYIGVGLHAASALPPATLSIALEEAAPPVDPCAAIVPVGLGANAVALNAAMPNLVIPTVPPESVYKVNYVSFTAPQAGVYRVANCTNSDFDSWIFVATQCNSTNAVIAVNDDGCGVLGGPSRLQFFCEAGETRVIGIGAWSSIDPLPPATVLSLTFLAPPADRCAPTNIISGVVGANTVPMSIAYRSLDLTGYCDPGPAGSDAIACARIIRFTAAVSGDYTVGNCGDTDPNGTGAVDARIAVLTDCGNPASVVACNDDGCTAGAAPYTARLVFTAVAGQTYYIAAGGFDETVTGPLHVTIEEPAPPLKPADINRDGRIDGADLALLLSNFGGTGTGDIDRSGHVDGGDLGLLLNAWGS